VTFAVNDGDGGVSTGSATAIVNVTADNDAPVTDLNGGAAGNDATASYPTGISQILIAPSATITDVNSPNMASLTVALTNPQDNSNGAGGIRELLSLNTTASAAAAAAGLTVSFASGNPTDPVTLSITGPASVATYQTILQGIQYTDTKSGSHNTTPRVATVVVNDGTADSVSHSVTISVAKPAGVAGEPINLALSDPTANPNDPITLKVAGVPSDWTLSGWTKLDDGSWTVQTSDPSALSITTAADYAGAMLLQFTESWTNADGTTETTTIADNVEAYAPGAPIFAVSSEDHLTGSSGSDLFVFAQPIANDTIYSFDAAMDKIDLVGFAGITGFSDIQTGIVNDANGNAVITLGTGETITLAGVDAAALGAGNFVFDQEPVTVNAGVMTISDGALLPLGGTINNTGTIVIGSTGSGTELEVLVKGVTLEGGGQVTLSDDSHNVILGGAAEATLANVDNTISGAGQLGGGLLTLVNEGTIIADGSNALVVDTGSNLVANSGSLEATGSGGLIVESSLTNSGSLWANGGNIAVHGDVTGGGSATISGVATLELGGTSDVNTTFADNGDGTLKLDHSSSFSGTISGFNTGDSLDLADILFGSDTTLSFSAGYTDRERWRTQHRDRAPGAVRGGRLPNHRGSRGWYDRDFRQFCPTA
jgi:hypothetical protein